MESAKYFATLGQTFYQIHQKLQALPDFEFSLHWSIHSSLIPLIQKFLPSDTFKIIKHERQIRLDFGNIKLPKSHKMPKSEFKGDFSLIVCDPEKAAMKDTSVVLLDWNRS